MEHYITLIIIMTLSGLLGGGANYFSDVISEDEKYPLVKRLIYGLAAAFVVPLFLNMISSSLLEDSKGDPIKLFVFAGFCIIAALSSKSFLTSISKKIIDKIDDVDKKQTEMEESVEPLLAKETEPASDDVGIESLEDLDEKDRKVLKSLMNEKWSRRNLNGIIKETGLRDIEVAWSLSKLRESGFVHKKIGKNDELWWLTAEGRMKVVRFPRF